MVHFSMEIHRDMYKVVYISSTSNFVPTRFTGSTHFYTPSTLKLKKKQQHWLLDFENIPKIKY